MRSSLFDLFSRSAVVKALDHALREAGALPVFVEKAVKFAMLQLQKKEMGAATANLHDAYDKAAGFLANSRICPRRFSESNSVLAASRARTRMGIASAAGASVDLKLVFPTRHSGLISPEVAGTFDIEDD